MGVARRRVQLGMSEQNLDHPYIGMVLHQMGGEGVPQRVRRHQEPSPAACAAA
jgi:hypothetical protein